MNLLWAATARKLIVPEKSLRPIAVRFLRKILKHPEKSCQSCQIPLLRTVTNTLGHHLAENHGFCTKLLNRVFPETA